MMEIPLTQGRVALVDDEDYPALSVFKWHFNNGYATRMVWHRDTKSYSRIWMQNVIMNVTVGTDHINRDRLDNRKSNLRLTTRSHQQHNRTFPKRSLPRGVRTSISGKFRAGIRVNYVWHELGSFITPEEASTAYQMKYYELHGEYPPE